MAVDRAAASAQERRAAPAARPPRQRAAPSGRRGAAWWAPRLLSVAAGLLAPLLALEVGLRLFGPFLPGNYDTGAYLARHPELGHFHVPGFDGWIKTSEFTTHVQINPLGLRDRRASYARTPGAYRVLLLGDSFVEAVQVAEADTTAARLEAGLTRAAGRPVEVLNAGVAGYGTGHTLLFFEHEGLRYQPDVAVLVVFLGNDVGDNNYQPDPDERSLPRRPYWTLRPDGSVAQGAWAPPPRPTDALQRLRDCCRLYNVVETGVLMKLGTGVQRDTPQADEEVRYLVRSLYDTRPEGEMLRGWQLTEGLLAALRDRAAAAGVPLVVVGAPDWLALDLDAWTRRLGDSRASSGRYRPDSPNARLGEISARLGLPYLDLYPLLNARAGGEPLYFPIDTHWTPAGHAVVAEAVERQLHELGLDGR